MLRYLLVLPLLLAGFRVQAQHEYLIDDFSPQYVARIHVDNDTSGVGWIAVYDQTKQALIKLESTELYVEPDYRRPGAAATRLPYAEQNWLISKDFNFDGRKDLAIQDGHNSCRGNVSFQVYLATPTGFAHSEAFTDLAQNYCGMFEVDAARKRISVQQTGSWGGEETQFSVRNNELMVVSRYREDQSQDPFVTYSREEWNGRRLVSTEWRELYPSGEEEICSFQLAENGKRVVLFARDSTTLYYALLRKDESVEFSYPALQAEGAQPFTLHKTGNGLILRFQNGSARYEIRETAGGALLVTARIGAKTLNMSGAEQGKKGSLKALLTAELENLTRQP
ncbi:XAC2610-related protein [Hymenobacter jeollabukensis]|uniref:VCBS repeat-containing protein n=1 Tax=Hymenobacter jeollabukensis TaxID=2025313 RepID=A0A5R8WHN0_9BACT|nr:hypothetical protein [Hymenobacter jeollabukensis]TLM88362.1 hypothetical protein FDY95_24595 [Hymenobacter jeollabukensis]